MKNRNSIRAIVATGLVLGGALLVSPGCGGGSGPGGGSLSQITNAIPGLNSSQRGDLGSLARVGAKGLDTMDLESPQRQQEIGQAIAVAITNRHRLSTDQKLTDYVNLVGLTVASVTSNPDIDYAFGILESNDVSAYSAPGGYVFITRGALALIEDEAELAAVLAHEVAHVSLGHGIDAVRKVKQTDLVISAMKTQGGELAAYGNLVDGSVEELITKGFSRPQETQADAQAIKYLAAAGYDPNGLTRFLQRLQAQTGPGGGAKQLMSTHPGTGERIAAVQRQTTGLRAGTTLRDRYRLNVSMN